MKTTPNQAEALRYAALGWAVLPLWPASKVPATKKERAWSTTDAAQVRRFWMMDSDQGIAVDLAPDARREPDAAHLFIIAPDNQARLDDFMQRGGLDGAAVIESQAGHQAFVFLAPPSCPRYRSCHPGDYDIVASGLYTLPPSIHPKTKKPRRWLVAPEQAGALPYPPQWAVDLLTEAAKRSRADLGSAAPTPTAAAGEDPPVRLEGWALELWRGQRFIAKQDVDENESVDRSLTLFHIGRELARAGMTARGIATFVRERDEALGYRKYTDRGDAAKRYAEIGQKTADEPQLIFTRDTSAGDVGPLVELLRRRLATAEAERDAARAEADESKAIVRAVRGVIANADLKAEAPVLIAVIMEVLANKDKADAAGLVPVPRARIAEVSGRAVDTVSTHVDALVKGGLVVKRVVSEPDERGGYTKRQYLGLNLPGMADGQAPTRTAEALAAAAKLTAADLGKTQGKGWGGRRICPDCGDAGTVTRVTVCCAGCGQVLEDRTTRHAPAVDRYGKWQDATSRYESTSEASPEVKWQDATFHNDEVESGQPRQDAESDPTPAPGTVCGAWGCTEPATVYHCTGDFCDAHNPEAPRTYGQAPTPLLAAGQRVITPRGAGVVIAVDGELVTVLRDGQPPDRPDCWPLAGLEPEPEQAPMWAAAGGG